MRKALNENPIVQIGLLAGLGVLVAVVFMSRMGGDSPPPAEEPAATEAAAPAPGTTVTPTAPAAPTAPSPGATPPAGAVEGGGTFEASKGLPKEFVQAYESGDITVLLVLDKKGFEDEALVREVNSAQFPDNTTIFFAVTKKGGKDKKEDAALSEALPVSKYSRVAEGVSLERAPAIIVLQPLEGQLAKGEPAPMPTASVTYGFRGKESVTQAVEDALYEGEQLGYDPG